MVLSGCKPPVKIEILQPPTPRTSVAPHGVVSPRVSGTIGMSTGTANFLGNFTAILQPSPTDYALVRQADCSLTLTTGLLTSTSAFTIASIVPHYDAVLRTLAALNTPAGTYPRGCADKSTGVSTRAGVFTGRTTQGLAVYVEAGDSDDGFLVNTAVVKADLSSATMNVISTLPNAGRVATADIDGDGNGDLVVINSPSTTANASVAVLLGNSDGSFKTPVIYPTAGGRSVSALIDDVNGDGKFDLVVASDTQQISILTGNGDGTFNPAQSFAAIFPGTPPTTAGIVNMITVDLRKSGTKDIVCSNGLVLLNNGNGTFTASATPAFPYPNSLSSSVGPFLATGDFNTDGKPDLVVSTGFAVSTWIGKGDGTFSPGNGYAGIDDTGYVTVSDLDGDGNDDIYIGLANGGVFSGDTHSLGTGYVLLGNGDGTFQGAVQGGYTYNGHNLADLNGDGRPDLISINPGTFSNPSNTFTVYLGIPSGFAPGATITTPAMFVNNGQTFSTANTSVTNYVVADVNGDGKPDLVYLLSGLFSPINGPFFFVALGNGDGTFATPVATDFPTLAPSGSFDVNLMVDGLQIADFDRDGKNDLLFTFSESTATPGSSNQPFLQGFAVLPGVGNGTFKPPVITYTYNSAVPTVLSPPEAVNIADLNGDGKPDLLVVARNGNSTTGFGTELRLYNGNGDGTFAAPSIITTATNPGDKNISNLPSPCLLADFNADGKPDLACLGETTGQQAQLAISLGNGNGTFAAPTILNIPGGDTVATSSLAAADFNADGNIDLALLDANAFSGIYYGQGNGNFTSVPNVDLLPRDLINLYASGAAIAVDLNKDGKPDLLVGNTVFLNTPAPQLVTTVASATTLTAAPTAITSGQSVTLTATVTGSAGVATGTVTFTDSLGGAGATTLGTGTLNASGIATLTTTALAIGSHAITATYGGSAAYNTSASTASTVVVSAPALVASTTTLVASPSSITTGQSVGLTATVTGAAGVPTGTVTFMDSLAGAAATTLGTGTLNASGVATLSATTLAIGSHALTAVYAGSAAYLTSTSTAATVTVAAPPTPDFSLALNPTSGSVMPGTTATTIVTVTPVNGFNQAISFACSGLPIIVTCSFSPATVTPSGGPATSTLTFTRTASGALAPFPLPPQYRGGVVALAILGWLSIPGRRRKLLPLLAGMLLMVSGCGHSNPPVTGSVIVTATSGTLSHTATYTLISQ